MSKSFYSRFSFGKLCKTQQMFERAGEYYTEQRTQIVHGRRISHGGWEVGEAPSTRTSRHLHSCGTGDTHSGHRKLLV